jgi:hypothetical protein
LRQVGQRARRVGRRRRGGLAGLGTPNLRRLGALDGSGRLDVDAGRGDLPHDLGRIRDAELTEAAEQLGDGRTPGGGPLLGQLEVALAGRQQRAGLGQPLTRCADGRRHVGQQPARLADPLGRRVEPDPGHLARAERPGGGGQPLGDLGRPGLQPAQALGQGAQPGAGGGGVVTWFPVRRIQGGVPS